MAMIDSTNCVPEPINVSAPITTMPAKAALGLFLGTIHRNATLAVLGNAAAIQRQHRVA